MTDDPGRSLPRQVAVVVNPRSGRNHTRSIYDAFAQHGVRAQFYETSRSDPGGRCTEQALAQGIDLLVAAGGDGTTMACANALVGTGVPLAIVPVGTGNIIATSLRLPTAVHDSVTVAMVGSRQRIDLGVCNASRALFFAGSIGFSAAVMRDATPALKDRIGMLAYALSAAWHALDPAQVFRIWLDDEPPIVRRSHGVLVGNFGQMMTKPRLPRTALDDGLLEVGVLRLRPFLDWARHDRPALRPPRRPPLDWYQAERVTIDCEHPQPGERDGDCVGSITRLEVGVLRQSLEVATPGSLGVATAGPRLTQLVSRDLLKFLGHREKGRSARR